MARGIVAVAAGRGMGKASFFLGDLNDYIQPGAVCVVPERAVALSLKDCLACSGCVTTAETMLVAQQSHAVVRDASTRSATQPLWCILAPTSRTAVARALGLSVPDAHSAVLRYLRQCLHTARVMDCAVEERLALRLVADEFLYRLRGGGIGAQPAGCADRPDDAHNGTLREENGALPMLSGECPGWVCYAEKRQAALLPHVARVRPPQQLCGALARTRLGGAGAFVFAVMPCYDKKLEASRAAKYGSDVDVVITTGELLVLMDEDAAARGISRPELVRRLLADGHADARACDDACHASAVHSGLGEASSAGGDAADVSFATECVRNREDAAGGYLLATLNAALGALCSCRGQHRSCECPACVSRTTTDEASPPSPTCHAHQVHVVSGDTLAASAVRTMQLCGCAALSATRVRGEDYVEYVLSFPHASLSFARVYGFRNIQTFLQRRKRALPNSTAVLAFVEVMACPGACLLGGGQPDPRGAADHRSAIEAVHVQSAANAHAPDAVDAEAARLHGALSADAALLRRIALTSYDPVDTSGTAPALHVQW